MRKLLLPLLSLALMAFAVIHVVRASQQGPDVTPPVEPARSPFSTTVAGAGMVEAETENIAVGSPLPGVVTKVHVKVGDFVEATNELFELDNRALLAELAHREASLRWAEMQVKRLDHMPREEECKPSAARVREAEVNLADQTDLMTRSRRLHSQGAIGDEEKERREQSYRMAVESLARVKAENELVEAGAWKWDKEVARMAVEQARAQRDQTKTELDRLVVRALVTGRVLQVNVRPGEFVGAPPGQALIVLGNTGTLHVRVDIDENDIPRFKKGAKAKAVLRGDPGREFALRFVRVEPYVVPKKSLIGSATERVDTRVLQIIYAIEHKSEDMYVGQQVDVFIDGTR